MNYEIDDYDPEFDSSIPTDEEIEAYKAELINRNCKECSREFSFHPEDGDAWLIVSGEFGNEQHPNPEYAYCLKCRREKFPKPVVNEEILF